MRTSERPFPENQLTSNIEESDKTLLHHDIQNHTNNKFDVGPEFGSLNADSSGYQSEENSGGGRSDVRAESEKYSSTHNNNIPVSTEKVTANKR